MIAKPYDMTNPADRSRWYREMIGYLSLSGEDNFLVQGTDRSGRKYAFEAFQSIKGEFDTFQSERSIRQDEREKVLGEIEHKLIESCSENYEPSGMGCKCCQFLIVYDEGLECAIKELRKEDKGK